MNNEKFDELYNEYCIRLYKYIFGAVKNVWDTEDIMADVFIKIYNNFDKVLDVRGINNWVFTIAHNNIVDFFRKNKRIEISDCIDEAFEDSGYEQVIIEDEYNQILYIISDFSEDTRKIFELRFSLNMKFKDIAKEMNISESTIKSKVKRSIVTIRKKYEYMNKKAI